MQCNAHFLSAYYKIYPEGDNRQQWFKRLFKKVYLDIDGILADFESHFLKYLKLPGYHAVDWNDPRFRDNFYKIAKDDKFWAGIKPLISPQDIKYPIAGYVTARPISDNLTQAWLDQYGFPKVELINVGFDGDKVKILKEKECDVFVDDLIKNFIECQSNGILCYLMTRPHNEKYNVGHYRVNNFQEFLDKL